MSKDNLKASALWKKYRETIDPKQGVRGYEINTSVSFFRIKFFLKLIRFLSFPIRALGHLHLFFVNFFTKFEKLIAFLVLGESNRHIRFSLVFGLDNYDPKLLDAFFNFTKDKILFSHNSLKSFDYLSRLDSQINLFDNFETKELNVFEIGAGVFNFGALLSLKVEKMNYVICDLPEMIEACKYGLDNLNKKGFDIEYYNSSEMQDFLSSDSKQKIIFFEPQSIEQIQNLDFKFDLFVNHESFAEMDLSVANAYLSQVQKYMKENGYVFLVNRHSRIQLLDISLLSDPSQITSFTDYNLDFCTEVFKGIDDFRHRLPTMRLTPNIIYVGKVVNSIN